MDAIEPLLRRYPDRARSIRRLHAADESFRAICEDYVDALRALEYWRAGDQSSQMKAAEYRRLIAELEYEAAAALTAYEGA